MARSSRNIVTVAASHADLLLPNAGGLFLFCMILMSFSVISVVIFSCGKSPSKKNTGAAGAAGAYYSGAAGDGTGCGGHGHHGHGGGGHGHGGHGGGCGGGGGGGCGSSTT